MRMVKSSKNNSPDKPQSKKRPRRPKFNPKKQQLPPTKAKVFSDIMNELLSNIVVVEPTAYQTSSGTNKACDSNPTVPSMPKTPVEPRTQTNSANVDNEDQFISETIITKVAFLFRVIEKLIKKGGLLAKKLWHQVERWVLAMVKCVVMEVTESARICFDKIIPVRLIQQFQDSLRICDEGRNDTPEAGTESAILLGQQTKSEEPEIRSQIFSEVSQEALEVPSIPKDSRTPPNSSLSPALFSLSTISSRCKTAFEPRSFQLPTMFPITKGGAKLARPIIKVDAADTYDIELAPKPFLYHYVSNVTANCCKTGISLFKCKSPVK